MLGEEGNGVGEERAVPEPPLRGDRRMGMDSRRRFHGGRALRGNNGGEGGFKVMTFDLCGDDAKQGAGRRVDGRHIW